MKRILFVLVMMALLASLVPTSFADDPVTGTKEDNACYEGGSMAGKCDSPWAWVCGYYLTRWEAAGGWNTPGNTLNDACVSLLPPKPIQEAPAGASTMCITLTGPFAGWVECVIGNIITEDAPPADGTIDNTYILAAVCPIGTIPINTVGGATPELRTWLNSLGFSDSTLVCQ